MLATVLVLGAVGAALTGSEEEGSGGTVASDAKASEEKPSAKSDDAAKDAGKDAAKDEEVKEKAAGKPAKKSQADEFKACVATSGTESEKAAMKHVVKVTGADRNNNFLDSAEVFTDYSGDMFSDDSASAKLIASAFASCYTSENGLVSVYNKAGDLLSNGNY